MNDTKYCLVGDLHGRVATMQRIISSSPGYKFIFIGDVIHHKHFFKRTKRTPPIGLLRTIQRMQIRGQAELILGNNENYILENLVLPRTKIRKKEVRYTMECLRGLELDQRLSLIRWLNERPLTMEFTSYGNTYRCAHGYYNPNYNEKTRNMVLLGPQYAWFKKDKLEDHIRPDAKYFFGHYGSPYFRKNLHIIDATNFEGVGVYYTDREEFTIYY